LKYCASTAKESENIAKKKKNLKQPQHELLGQFSSTVEQDCTTKEDDFRAVFLKPGVATHLCVANILQCVTKNLKLKVFAEIFVRLLFVLSSRHYKFGRLSINKTRPMLMNQN
jgi:hypothetical protein